MGLAGGIFVQFCVVNDSAWATISLGSHHHATAPGDGAVHWHPFNDP